MALFGLFGSQFNPNDPIAQLPTVAPSLRMNQLPQLTAPAPSPGSTGLFGDDPGSRVPGRGAASGGAFGLGPLTGSQKTALLFAGLRDAATGFTRNPSDDLDSQRRYIMQGNQLGGRQQAAQAMMNATTPQEMKAAAMQYLASGGDMTGFAAAMNFGKPEIKTLGRAGAVVTDPVTGLPIGTLGVPQQLPQKPMITGNGLISYDNGRTWSQIPGYVAQSKDVGDAKRPPAKQPAPGAINIPHPSTAF